MKTLKAFIKPSEAPQRSVKIKLYVNFFLFVGDWDGKRNKAETRIFVSILRLALKNTMLIKTSAPETYSACEHL